MKRRSTTHPTKHLRPPIRALVVVIPLVIGVATLYLTFGPELMTQLANRGNARLVTDGWQSAEATMTAARPTYGTKFAYYKLQEGQDLAWAAAHFSVSLAELQQLNPGQVVWGTTIKVPPVEHPLAPFPASADTASAATVTERQGVIYVNNRFVNPEAHLTIPDLMRMVQPYNGITQLGPKTYMINIPLYIQDNIQVDVTSDTVSTLYLRSQPNYSITTLTFQNAETLFNGVHISSYDPTTGQPDTNISDGRSFVRAYDNGRMDMLNATASYLGMTIEQIRSKDVIAKVPFAAQGGVYGVSWRIATGSFGENIVTGWVQNSTFSHNNIGAFTFGAQGMMWTSNLFTANRIYGLDPHDDSNNATIEYNRFVANGKHGFIVSKRCDYNIIENNISIDNKYHGFMLHDNSDYNIFKNNIAIGNQDNFVIYGSSLNTVQNNRGYNPRGSQVRINAGSIQNYVENNTFYGGKRGVYLYDSTNGADISNNHFVNVNYQLVTSGATRVLFAGNESNGLGYKTQPSDRVVFGINTINKHQPIDLQPLSTVLNGQKNHTTLTTLAATALEQ